MRIFSLAFICWIFPVICLAAPLGYNGLNIGISRESAERKLADLDCRNYPECEYNDTIKGELVLVKLRFEDNRLVQVDLIFSTEDFPVIKNALIRKRGNPTKVKDVIYQDASNARSEYHELLWTLRDGSITADEFYFTVDTQKIGRVSIVGKGVTPKKLVQEY